MSELVESSPASDQLTSVLECLALPFAAHPDFDESWIPAEVTA